MAKRDKETESMLRRLVDLLAVHGGNTAEASRNWRTDAEALRRISMTLHRWHELECGVDDGCIERDEATGKPFYRSGHNPKIRYAVRDRETSARKRLATIMARYPSLGFYVQGDPRGAALYILRPGDVPAGENADSFYPRGLAVYK